MFEHELMRLRDWGRLAVVTLIACLAMGVGTASAGHRPGCHSRCRNWGGAGASPGAPRPPRMSLIRRTVSRHGHFVDVRLRCREEHRACRGVLVLDARRPGAPELSRVDLRIPPDKTWTIQARLSRRGLRYLKARHRVRGELTLGFRDSESRSFRIVIVG